MKKLLILLFSLVFLSVPSVAQVDAILPTSGLPQDLTFVSKDSRSVTSGSLALQSAVGLYKDGAGTEYSMLITQVKGGPVEDFWSTFVLANKDLGETETSFKGKKALQGTRTNYGFALTWLQGEGVVSITATRDTPDIRAKVQALAELVEGKAPKQPGFEILWGIIALLAVGFVFRRRSRY